MTGLRPPMGWNSWNTFGTDISEKLILETADAMVEKGYRDVGYTYVIIDDGWSLHARDEKGHLVPDPAKFPHGIKYLADAIHEKGLKFGIYSCAGVMTCGGYPGSFGHEYTDAADFAAWGVDYLKYDYCHFPTSADGKNAYLAMSLALRASGREILFAACNWGAEEPWKWMRSVGVHTYRSTGDIVDSYKSYSDIAHSQEDKLCMSGNFCYNDVDMMTVGMYGKGLVGIGDGCNDTEYLEHFALWCLYSAPLIMGGDIRNLSENARRILQNRDLIAIDQDIEARPPIVLMSREGWRGPSRAYFKVLSDNEYVLLFANFVDGAQSVPLSLADIGIPYESGMALDMKNAVTGESAGLLRDYCHIILERHECLVLKGKLVHV